MNFLNIPDRNKILITLNSASVLIVMNDFPEGFKMKLTYILKKESVVVTENNYESILMCGEISPSPIEDLKLMSENVSFIIYILNCLNTFYGL